MQRDDKRADRSAALVVQKITLTAIVARADNSIWRPLVRGPMAKPPRDRRTQPAPERAYERADPRIDRLEDTISHFYNVINELRERVSTLEKKLKLLAKDQLH